MAPHHRHLLLKALIGINRIHVLDTTSTIRINSSTNIHIARLIRTVITLLNNNNNLGRYTIKVINVPHRKTIPIKANGCRREVKGETEARVATDTTIINSNAEVTLDVVVNSNRNKVSIFVRTTKLLDPLGLNNRQVL